MRRKWKTKYLNYQGVLIPYTDLEVFFFFCNDSIICDFRLMDVLLRIYKQEILITTIVQGQIFLLFAEMVD